MTDLQRASLWKRISAFLFDGILLGIAAVLFAWLLSLALGFDGYNRTLDACYARYEAAYQVDFRMTLSEYESMTAEQASNLEAAYAALSADAEAVHAYGMVLQLTLLIVSLGILLACLALEFAVPLMLKNGQTLGKKIFGVGLMRTDGIRVNAVCLFIRTFLGKYTLETMIPVILLLMLSWGSIGLMGTLILGLIALLQLMLLLIPRNHTPIHDLLAGTVAIDVASQRIFDTREDKIAYQQRVQAEKAARQPY